MEMETDTQRQDCISHVFIFVPFDILSDMTILLFFHSLLPQYSFVPYFHSLRV
jgi:hypothetical protein